LAAELDLSVANTSQHLQTLKQTGLVATRRSGTSVRYRLASPEVFAFLSSLRALAAARLGDVDRLALAYLGDRDGEPPITRDALARRLGEKGMLVLDVRPREEFESGHLPGAISAPLEELTEHLRLLPKDAQIVVYCRGPYCAYSHAAVTLLRKRGFRAMRLEDGLPEWEAADYPVERGAGQARVSRSQTAAATPDAAVIAAATAMAGRVPAAPPTTPASVPPAANPRSRQKR
jgi:rhodanese-related sulfurtransferase